MQANAAGRVRGRWTNQLQFIWKVVYPEVTRSSMSWPFKTVESLKQSGLGDSMIDLQTIKTRLRMQYYMNAQECIADFNRMLSVSEHSKPDQVS